MSHYATQPSSAESRNLNEDENRELNTDFNNMMTYAEINDEIAQEEARDIASRLLMHPNLPPLLRADAHMILACGNVDYLYHAQEAVRIAESCREQLGPGETPEAREEAEYLLDKARETLRYAKCDSAELKRIKEGLEAGTIKKPKRGTTLMYGGSHLDEESDDAGSDSGEIKIERRTVGKRKIDRARYESDDSEAEKNIDDEAEQDVVKSDSNPADDSEAPQSEIEKSTRTKRKGKRKSCSASDDSGEEENVVEDKKHSSSKGRKASKLAITP